MSNKALSLMDQLAEHEQALREHSTTQSMTPQWSAFGGVTAAQSVGNNAGYSFEELSSSTAAFGDTRPQRLRPKQASKKIEDPRETHRKKQLKSSSDISWAVTELLSDAVPSPENSEVQADASLPLEFFQNKEMDSAESRRFIEQIATGEFDLKDKPRKCTTREAGGTGSFVDAKAMAYDGDSDQYTVFGTGGKRKVQRIHTCIDGEDRMEFADRYKAALNLRAEAEALIRYHLYVDCMPADEQPQMDSQQVNRILDLALSSRRIAPGANTSNLLEEANLEYVTAMNKLIFDANRENIIAEFPELNLPKPRSTPKAPESAVVAVPHYDLEQVFGDFTIRSAFFTSFQALEAMLSVRELCNSAMETECFYDDTGMALTLEQYQQQQNLANQRASLNLKDNWPSKTNSNIKSCVLASGDSSSYNLTESDRSKYQGTRLQHLFTCVDLMMADSLRFLMQNQLASFTDVVVKGGEATVTVKSRTEVESSKKLVTPMFALSLRVSTDKKVINQEEIDEAEAEKKAWMDEHRPATKEELKDNPDWAKECEIKVPEPNIGHIFEYDTPVDAFGETILGAFDKTLESLSDIPKVEMLAMDRLYWPTRVTVAQVGVDEPWVQELRQRLVDTVCEKASGPMDEYLEAYEEYIDFLNLDVDEYLADLAKKINKGEDDDDDDDDDEEEGGTKDVHVNVGELRNALSMHEAQKQEVMNTVPKVCDIGMFKTHCAVVRTMLADKHQTIIDSLLESHRQNAVQQLESGAKKFETVFKKLRVTPKDIEQLTELSEYMADVPNQLEPLLEQIETMKEWESVLEDVNFKIDLEHSNKSWALVGWPKQIYECMEDAKAILEDRKVKYAQAMADEQVKFGESLIELEKEAESFVQYTDLGAVDQVAARAKSLETKLAKAGEDAMLYNARESLFEKELTDYDSISRIKRIFDPYNTLWSTTSQWLKLHRNWTENEFEELNAEDVEKQVSSFFNAINKAEKYFKNAEIPACQGIASSIKAQVDAFKPNVPLIQSLRNPGMRDRHWDRLSNELGFHLNPVEDHLTLNNILELDLTEHTELIQKVAESAGKEYQIELALNNMEDQWKGIDLQIVPYRETGTCVLKSVDEIQAVLDEHITMTQAMQFSAFKKPFEERIDGWDKTITCVSDVLEEWMAVQRNWLYLQPIFESPDINKQLPAEGKRFATVDKNWRQTMSKAKKTPNTVTFCNNDKLLEMLQESNLCLDLVQKGLSDYLETKRSSFARFYFLSNDELLSILSESKDVKLVQPHLKKCFEGIRKVKFESDLQISEIISGGEKVPCFENIDPNGKNVEHWMLELEKMMKVTIRHQMYLAVLDYAKTPRPQWMQAWPAMCILNGSQLHWTKEMEAGMLAGGNEGLKGELEKQKAQLQDMVFLVRGDLGKEARTSIGALTVIDVHARDVTIKMINEGVEDANNFEWSSQLRYYWLLPEGNIGDPIVESGDMYAQMVASRRPYGYEYLGNSFRLVITPLTDKCYLTIMGALQMILGGAPAGPAGTGKTETTKDLAKALAKQCVVFNCSDGLDYIAMGKFFKGLASCGAWACFDEFNRIDIEVLSVVGQQIMTIQLAIMHKQERIMFEDSDIYVDPQFGVFITMNPGYAGRSDLPDSLQALFRPVAMMVPDYALIGEIMFFAYGFELAKLCGAKMVTTFKLCSEQLSSQSHYDYGMRAVKTVITAAGNLKRVDPDMDEEVLLLRALQDVNLPKFLAHDLPLFAGIISDLFPGKKRPHIDLGALIQCIKICTDRNELQPHPFFLTKTVQLYETICVRHGLMVVGPTGGGKSSNIRTLANALTELKKRGDKGVRYEKVQTYQLNPKSITMGQLYGQFDPNTHEWEDGILSTLYRAAASDPSSDSCWVLFDGPVDAIWIENMNTVLDDNKKLCLNSGEMLQMSDEMTMMFEVQDLAVASPATVSRCGMVYMEPASLGLDPLIASWLEYKLPPLIPQEARVRLQQLFDTYLECAAVRFLREFLKELVPTVNNALAQSLMNIMDCYFVKYIAVEGKDPPKEDELKKIVNLCEPLFIFSLIWSVGCTCNEAGRSMFDAWLRSEMQTNGSKVQLPNEGLVYDYKFDEKKEKWILWVDTVATQKVDAKMEFSEIVVDTMDSIRNNYLLETLLQNKKHTLMVGGTGTGKTVNISQYLAHMPDKYIPLTMTFSAQTSANQVQDTMDSKMEKRKRGIFGPSAGKEFVIYVDDLNMPTRETYFAQPPIEILRQWFDQSGWYDRKALVFRKIIDILFVASMGPPGGGRNPITPRFLRHFNVIGYAEMSDKSKGAIFQAIMDSFLTSFNPALSQLTEPMVISTIDIYNRISEELLPTPAKAHYTFNLRDLAKVFQGVLMASDKLVSEPPQLIRLWMHECKRVFEDRLINREDHQWFEDILEKQLTTNFSTTTADIVSNERLIYGDYMIPGAEPRLYDEVSDMSKLQPTIEQYLVDYNAESKSPMPLVMFLDAIEHVSRVSRVIRQPRGNALLLGVGGSGRQSLTRLATYMAEYKCFQVEIAKGYGVAEWREDVKTCLLQAGVKDTPIVFLFSDVQIVNDIMLEDINGILNAGDVPNLYAAEDLDAINSACRVECQKRKIPPTKLNIFTQYLVRVRRNIHVCLAMSPIGDAFRDRLRMFPALVNCCTIDWFAEWPAEALKSVAIAQLNEEGEDLHLGNDEAGLVSVFKVIHQSVERKSKDFYEILRRHNYVTPTSYLELLSMFKKILAFKRSQVDTLRSRLQVGVDKISATKEQVAVMQQELTELQPVLTKTQLEVDEMMVVITKDKAAAAETKIVVEKEEDAANKKAAATKEIADDAQRDLDEALPALDAAVQCLNKLKKSDIDEVKSLKTPPGGVKLTMEVVCIMFGHKPVKKNDPDTPGKKIEDYWETAQKHVLVDAKRFMDSLVHFDKDNIPDKVIAKIKPYIESPDFTPAAIEKASKACTAVCMWARAMDTYHRVALQVEPKKRALAQAQADLDVTLKQLAGAQAELKGVVDRLTELEKNFNGAVAKKEQLANQVKKCEIQLSNAEKLIGGLGGEEKRWKETVAKLNEDFLNVTGDCVVSAGTISYLGSFTSEFRDMLVEEWRIALGEAKLKHTPGVDIETTLTEPVKLRSWQLAGLPTDSLSTQNGLVMDRARRWPLCIDPQGQANRFIKTYGKDKDVCENSLEVIKLSDKNFLRSLENGVRFGKWILLENILEELDASLEPILLQQKFKQGGQEMMRIGDNTIPYNDSFRFYITTKLPNPHYPPEVCVKVTLLNFTITMVGLEEQLLVVAVQEEMPDLAEKKTELMISNAAMSKTLYDIETQILYLLSHSEGNILDDTNLIDTLAQAKATSTEVTAKMKEAEVVEKEIDEQSNNYRPVAYQSSILFFTIADLAMVDTMYQYSLPWFTQLFIMGIAGAESSSDTDQRLQNLNDYFMYSVYKNVCRSLFERHKLLFSFLMTIKVLQGSDKIDAGEWRFLISGIRPDSVEGIDNPDTHWIDIRCWSEICAMSTLPVFEGLAQGFNKDVDKWRAIFDSATPETATFPGKWNKINSLQKMCIIRALRPDTIMLAMQNYVIEQLDDRFIKPPVFDLAGTYQDSTPMTPLIFILTSGCDPGKDLITFAQDSSMGDNFKSIALGQGQGKLAQRMIESAVGAGGWVLLQNCHLSVSWMPELERICEEFDPTRINPDFRLWLTSMPSKAFPTSVLQNGVKMTKEPPKGVRANLNQSFFKLNEDLLNKTNDAHQWRKLLFALCFFHANIIERKKFGPLGWNIPYAFNDTDLDISQSQLELFLDAYDEVPYQVLCHMTSVVNYGGRVTDDKDMRTSEVILSTFFNPEVLDEGYTFSKSGLYKSHEYNADSPYDSYVEYIDSLPINPDPEVFGMHDNANITCAQTETYANFDIILSLQPRIASGGGKSREDLIGDSAADIEARIRDLYNVQAVSMMYPVTYDESMNTVLVQELQKFNRLLGVMKSSLFTIQKALKGLVVMSADLDAMGTALYNQKTPEMWEGVAYPSLMPLGAWTNDLIARLDFYTNWVKEGIPPIFWISAFFFPQAFMTGTLQNFARRHQFPIDTVSNGFKYLEEEADSIKAKPDDGCFIRGLFCEGARFDKEVHALQDPLPKELFSALPVIHLAPVQHRPITTEGIYRCPVYKILTRTGTLSTTGHSTNFVFWMEMPSVGKTVYRQSLVSETNANIKLCDDPDWVKAGVACFCALRF